MSDDKEVDRESYYQGAADVWERGCRNEPLDEKEAKRFKHLARSRFYTFVLSASHAQVTSDGAKVKLLVRSLALDLTRAPGLEREWHDSEFAEDEFGAIVTAMLDEVRE